MATWKKVVVSGSAAELSQLNVGANQQISSSAAFTFLSGSFSGSFRGDGSGITGISATNATLATSASNTAITNTTSGTAYYITFVASGSGTVPQLVNSSSLSYNANTNTITATASFSTTASYVLNAVSASFASTASSLTNAATASLFTSPTFTGTVNANNVSIAGNLSVAGVISGSVTYISASNVAITDQFILLASGSTGNIDGGIIVQNAANAGEALFWDSPAARWAITSSLSTTANVVTTPSHYIVTVTASAGIPTANVYGGTTAGQGNIYVNSSDESIWIYS